MKQTSAIVAAILLASAMIAAAIYLRPAAPSPAAHAAATPEPTAPAAPQAQPTAPAPAAPLAPTPPVVPAPPAAALVPSAPAPQAVSGPALEAKVRAALAKELVLWREQCWDALAAKTPGPTSTRFTLNMNFAADGSEIGRGMISARDAGRPDVNLCVNRLPASLLKLEPIGAPATVDLEIVLP